MGERLAHGTPFRCAWEDGLLDNSRVVQVSLSSHISSLQTLSKMLDFGIWQLIQPYLENTSYEHWRHFWRLKTTVLPFIVPLQLRVTGDGKAFTVAMLLLLWKFWKNQKGLNLIIVLQKSKRLEFGKYFSQVGLRGTGWGHGDLGWGREQVDFDFDFNANFNESF